MNMSSTSVDLTIESSNREAHEQSDQGDTLMGRSLPAPSTNRGFVRGAQLRAGVGGDVHVLRVPIQLDAGKLGANVA